MGSITTRSGDCGQTYTLGGDRVFKNDLRVVVPGYIDQLITHISLLKLQLVNCEMPTIEKQQKTDVLTWIQTCCCVIASNASDPYHKNDSIRQITENEVSVLDTIVRKEEAQTKMPSGFIIPGQSQFSCQLDIARVYTRNLERVFVELWQKFPDHQISLATLAYLNRLSDFFYIWARADEKGKFTYVDYNSIR